MKELNSKDLSVIGYSSWNNLNKVISLLPALIALPTLTKFAQMAQQQRKTTT